MGQRASNTAGVTFEDVVVPKEVSPFPEQILIIIIIIIAIRMLSGNQVKDSLWL